MQCRIIDQRPIVVSSKRLVQSECATAALAAERDQVRWGDAAPAAAHAEGYGSRYSDARCQLAAAPLHSDASRYGVPSPEAQQQTDSYGRFGGGHEPRRFEIIAAAERDQEQLHARWHGARDGAGNSAAGALPMRDC